MAFGGKRKSRWEFFNTNKRSHVDLYLSWPYQRTEFYGTKLKWIKIFYDPRYCQDVLCLIRPLHVTVVVMFWGLSSTFSEHYQPRALVLKLHEPPTPFYTWVSMHTHAAFSYQFSHVWTINVDALISNPYYVCTSNLQRNPKNQKKKKPSVTPRVLYVVFLFLQLQSFSYNPIF